MGAETQDAVQGFINHHVMRHAGSTDVWNLPFVHLNALEWFHYDSVMVFVVVALLLAAAVAVRRRYAEIPKGIAAIAEAYVVFIRDQVVYPNFGPVCGRGFISFFCTLFVFILFANLLGLVPIFSTATGNVSVTAGLATIFMFTCLGAVIKLRGLRGLKSAFIPHGLPGWLVPVMAVMEVISFFSRVFALTIRLFCNLLAGHIVIYSLLGMVVLFGWAAFPAVVMAVLMYFFELFVAFLQAYIFTLLSAIFMNMMLNPEH
ncbi:MAG TPA: F0F1 ATP synthase subunit A [Kiritimatiellia bacterium]|mgnify:CR=1 FL=1|nr:F0F1 ATP synthase subunit A [Kiritimatiellia bacterium]HPS09619.1 F0F1 ATP synthase subunit A [Kiritimatiellia bacterium]